MDLRVTPLTLLNRTVAGARLHADALGRLQEQASTGLRLLRPSDGPLDTIAVLADKSDLSRFSTNLTNIRDARTTLDLSVSALQEGSDILSSARQIAIEGAQASNDGTSFESLASEVDGLIQRTLNVANTQQNGRYLFSGTATLTQPFTVSAGDSQGRPSSVVYGGGNQRVVATVGKQETLATFYPGSEVFQRRQRGATVITGDTGAKPGTGTDSGTGQATLTITHTSTAYAPGSGIQAGSSSVTGDTILGPVGTHVLHIVDTSGNGSRGTVALDGGPPIDFTSSNTDLKITGPRGDIVRVDTTAITPGFNGDVAITANGTLSLDNGASQVPINYSGNQIVKDSKTGAVTNIDSSKIQRAGQAHVEYPGTFDAFQILIALRDDLRNTRGLSDAQHAQAISDRIGEIDRTRTGLLQTVGEQSASLQNLDTLENRVQDQQLEVQRQTTDLESADISSVVLHIQSEQQLFQLTLQASAKIIDLSLADFLK